MKWVRQALFASALAGAAAVGSSALADTYWIGHTGTLPGNWESLDVAGVDSNAPAVGIVFTIASGSPTGVAGTNLLVLCDDLFHTVSVPVDYSGHPLIYNSANLSGNFYYTSGGTQNFDLAQASKLGQLVTEAQDINTNGGSAAPADVALLGLTPDQEIAAIQGAIWGIEYKTTVTDNNNTANFDTAITDFEAFPKDLTTDGIGLYSTNGTQNQLLGVPLGTEGGPGGIPEPAAWLTMLLGITAAGALLRRSRALATVVA
jgi:hypothetical protein